MSDLISLSKAVNGAKAIKKAIIVFLIEFIIVLFKIMHCNIVNFIQLLIKIVDLLQSGFANLIFD